MVRKLKLKLSGRLLKKKSRKSSFGMKKHCRFCNSDQNASSLDFKNVAMLRNFITERSKILPSRISGACAKHQRALNHAIKNARIMALLPFTAEQR